MQAFRVYPEETVHRIRFIRQAQELGFSLKEIDELLSVRRDPGADSADVRTLAIAKRNEVGQKIARLQEIHAALDELISACPGKGALHECSIMETLSDVGTPEDVAVSPKKRKAAMTRVRRLLIVGLFLVFAPVAAMAVSPAYKLQVDGLACPFCAYGVEKKLNAVNGVKASRSILKAGPSP